MNNIFDRINELLGRPRAPVEYIYSLPYTNLYLPLGGRWVANRAGHAAIRYNETIVSVSKYTKSDVMYYDPIEYLYMDKRDKISILIHDVPSENIKTFYQDSSIKYKPIAITPDQGNCADWVSRALKKINILTHHHMFPKGIFIDLFENLPRDQFSVVYYRQEESPARDIVNPIQLFRNWVYSHPEKFADVIVDTTKDPPEIFLNPDPVQPNKLRNVLNYKWTIIPSTIVAWFVWRKNLRTIKHIRQHFQAKTRKAVEKMGTAEEKLMYLLKIQNKKTLYAVAGTIAFTGLLIQANHEKIKDYFSTQSTEIASTTLESEDIKEKLIDLTKDESIQKAVEDLLIKSITSPTVQTELNKAFLEAARYTVQHQDTLEFSKAFAATLSKDPKIHQEIWNALLSSVSPF